MIRMCYEVNMFVNELVRHIRLIKNEDVLLHYLSTFSVSLSLSLNTLNVHTLTTHNLILSLIFCEWPTCSLLNSEQTKKIGTVPGQKTRVRLYITLLDLSTPGLPLYPTRNIRHQAKDTLDFVFPVSDYDHSNKLCTPINRNTRMGIRVRE
jgi:hypothetical protein